MNEDNIYKKTVICPICGKETKNNMYKKGSFKIDHQDYDMCISYEGLNPIYYSVNICNNCGYTNIDKYFDKIRRNDKENIKKNLTPRWNPIEIPSDNDVYFSIYLYKLALLNRSFFEKDNFGELAVINLRLSWLYKELNDKEQIKRFRKSALSCFLNSYQNEKMPVGGLYDQAHSEYLISILYYYLEDYENALKWISLVLYNSAASSKLKEKIREIKELIPKYN